MAPAWSHMIDLSAHVGLLAPMRRAVAALPAHSSRPPFCSTSRRSAWPRCALSGR